MTPGRAGVARVGTAVAAALARGAAPRSRHVNAPIPRNGVSPSLKSRLRSAAGRLLSGCQRRPEQRHTQQSFTGRASVWGEGRERDRPPHAHTRTHTRRNLLQAPSSSHPNADFFSFLLFFFFCFWKNKDFGVGWRCCFSGVAVGGWGGGWRWRGETVA